MQTAKRPVPITDDEDTGGYWDAAQRGAVAVLFCDGCGRALHLPTPSCPSCGTDHVSWRDVRPTGTVYSWTVVTHAIHPGFPVPYAVVLVELDDVPGVRVVTNIDGRPELRVGTPMRAVFDDVRDGTVVPQWVPA